MGLVRLLRSRCFDARRNSASLDSLDLHCFRFDKSEDTTCNGHEGCYGGQGWCHCEGKTGCQGVGGIWNAQTCAMEVDKFRPCQKVPE